MLVHMTDICKDYTTGRNVTHVLKRVCLSVDEGDYLAIMGPSGSGKSTLMNLLGFLDIPTSGEYLFCGRDFSHASDNELADVRNHDIGFVFQTFHLLPKLTALDNAALPLLYGGVPKARRREMAAEALRTVGLEDRMEHLPAELSGGQCQRVAIARAIVGRPKLLLADEPTGSVDPQTAQYIFEAFQRLNRETGLTIVIVTHDMSVAAKVSRVMTIRDGKISAEHVLREDYREKLMEASLSDNLSHEEFAVLDRSGRVQLTPDFLSAAGITGKRVKMTLEQEKIVISAPEQQ